MPKLVDDTLSIRRYHVGWSVTVLQLEVTRRHDTGDVTVYDRGAVNHVVVTYGMVCRLVDTTNAPTARRRSRFNDQAQRYDHCQAHYQAIHSSSP
jgi:hypothetical protein